MLGGKGAVRHRRLSNAQAEGGRVDDEICLLGRLSYLRASQGNRLDLHTWREFFHLSGEGLCPGKGPVGQW